MRILAIRNTLSSVRNESCTMMNDSNLAEIAARIIDKLDPLVDERFGDLIIGDALRETTRKELPMMTGSGPFAPS